MTDGESLLLRSCLFVQSFVFEIRTAPAGGFDQALRQQAALTDVDAIDDARFLELLAGTASFLWILPLGL